MLRIGQVEATATQDGKYTDGSVAGGIAATRLRAAAFNAMQEELAHIVESAGLALDINNMTQVLKAIQKLTLSRANPFADIKSDGAAAISTALTNLGLSKSRFAVVTSSQTITIPDWVTEIYVTASAGGSGGGGSGGSVNMTGTGAGGQGGSAGESVVKRKFTVVPGSTINVTIGAGGDGGVAGGPSTDGGDGSSGGNTVIGSLLTLKGGDGGRGGESFRGSILPGGGSGANGYPAGQDGQDGANGILGNGCGGNGANSFFGGGAGGSRSGSAGVNGKDAYGYGSGGSGAGGGYGGSGGGSNGGVGGKGASGIVIIEW